MPETTVFVDFAELSEERLEFLVEDLLLNMGFAIDSRPSRGPDQGKDLLAVKTVTDELGITEAQRLLVECKHFYGSKKSVREPDIGNFHIKMMQHKANRYLLVTTSTVSETVKNQLKAVNDNAGPEKAAFWTENDLTGLLQKYPGVLSKYFCSWEAEAREAAMYFSAHHHPAVFGAALWCPGVTAIIGNDDYRSEPGKARVERLRAQLAERDIQELSFSTCKSDSSWALLVRSSDAHELHSLVWNCIDEWQRDHPANRHQQLQAADRLYSYWTSPHKFVVPIRP